MLRNLLIFLHQEKSAIVSAAFNLARRLAMTVPLHCLYSFRRCPYAMRARLGIVFAGLQLELREIVLRNKPVQMLEISPKGTVPVLQIGRAHV